MVKKLKFTESKEPATLRLDLGTGKGAKLPDGFIGVDLVAGKGVLVADLRKRWPWKSGSVEEVNADYLVQYFTAVERVHFCNELYRVLVPGGRATVITPYWCAHKAYMDINVQWPPVAEGWYPTLNKAWRDAQNYADRSGYACDFDYTLGYGMHQHVLSRNQEYQQHAVHFWKEAAQDLHATLIKR